MNRSQTAEAISGRAAGVLFFAGFGTLWLCTGLAAMHRLNYVTGTLLVLWSVSSVFILSRENVASTGALGTSAILLPSAAYTMTNAAPAAASISKNAPETTSVGR